MTTKRLTCCWLGRTGETCGDGAEWEIWDGIQPYFDHYIHACTEHVGALLTDRPEHRVYRISTTPSYVPPHATPGASVASRSFSGSGDAGVDRSWVGAVMKEIEGEKVTITDFTGNPVVDVIRSLRSRVRSSRSGEREAGFREGVEAAAVMAADRVAAWALTLPIPHVVPPAAAIAKEIRVLSSAPPSPSVSRDAEDHPPSVLADAALLLRKSDPEIAAGLDALIRSWPAAPSPRSEAESDCVCGHPYLAHVGVHHGCIGIDCGPGCVDECQGAGCHCTRYRPRAPVPAESATKGEEDGR